MRSISARSSKPPIERCFDLSRSIELHLLGTEQTGEQAVGGVSSGLIGPGDFVTWRAKHFGITHQLTSRIAVYDRPYLFTDQMTKGAFRSMEHDHIFKALSAERTEMNDRFVFEAPFPLLGRLAEKHVLRRYMLNLLTHRNAILKQAAESEQWKELLPQNVLPETEVIPEGALNSGLRFRTARKTLATQGNGDASKKRLARDPIP